VTRKFKIFLAVCAVLALLMQGVVIGLLALRRENPPMVDLDGLNRRVDDIYREIVRQKTPLSNLVKYATGAWVEIDPENKRGKCVVEITPNFYTAGVKAVLVSDMKRYAMQWDKEKKVFFATVTLPLAKPVDSFAVFELEMDEWLWQDVVHDGPNHWYACDRFGYFEAGCLVLKAVGNYKNIHINDKTFHFKESFSMSEEYPLPFGSKFKSGRLFVVEAETGKELCSVPIDAKGVAKIDETFPLVAVELRAELLCEDGMTYRYGIVRIYPWDDYDFIFDLTAVFPDGKELSLPIGLYWNEGRP